MNLNRRHYGLPNIGPLSEQLTWLQSTVIAEAFSNLVSDLDDETGPFSFNATVELLNNA